MSDLDRAKSVVSDLETRRTVLAREGTALAVELAHLAYAAFADGAENAHHRLERVQALIAANNTQQAAISAALNVARAKLEEAKATGVLVADKERVAHIHTILPDLIAAAPVLDVMAPTAGRGAESGSSMPTSETPRYLGNPPAQAKVAALVSSLLDDLRGLGLAGPYHEQVFDIGTGGKRVKTVELKMPPWNFSAVGRSELGRP